MLIVWCWLIAVISVVLAYIVAGPIWKREHSMLFGDSEDSLKLSGMFGEIFLISAAALFLAAIDEVCEEVSVRSVLTDYPDITIPAFILVLVAVYAYGVYKGLNGLPGEKRRLTATYMVYGIFSTVVFAGLCVLAALMISEAVIDANKFSVEAEQVLSRAQTLGGLPIADQTTGLNLTFLDAQAVLKRLEGSMSPVFVFAAGLFAFNLVVRYTPLSHAFAQEAKYATYVTTFAALALVVITGIWVYTGQYSTFIGDVLEVMAPMREDFFAAAPDYNSRYTDIWLRLVDDQALLGFLSRMSDQWGGVAALLGIFQWSAERFNKPEARAKLRQTTAEGAV
ncbi:hypothetical protein WNY37_16410 [Henriciella sp. AS95]|uniref:hypothetical protein n=1 Tax=Henriciella sp. AS95 TaxID=3135782 RepID=UPI00317A8EAD